MVVGIGGLCERDFGLALRKVFPFIFFGFVFWVLGLAALDLVCGWTTFFGSSFFLWILFEGEVGGVWRGILGFGGLMDGFQE